MTSATVAFSVGRAASDGAAAAGVGCVLKNFIRVGPVHYHRRRSAIVIRVVPVGAPFPAHWSRCRTARMRSVYPAASAFIAKERTHEKASLGASGVARVAVP